MHLLACPLVRSHGYTSSRCISGFFDPFNNRSHTLHSLTNILAANQYSPLSCFHLVDVFFRPCPTINVVVDKRASRRTSFKDRKSTRLNSSHLATSYAVSV